VPTAFVHIFGGMERPERGIASRCRRAYRVLFNTANPASLLNVNWLPVRFLPSARCG